MSKVREPFSFIKTLTALLLIVLCLLAAQWQFNRGVNRHARNSVITARVSLPAINLDLAKESPTDFEWQTVITTGSFDASQQILLRNRYSEGVYGFEVLTLFTAQTGESRKHQDLYLKILIEDQQVAVTLLGLQADARVPEEEPRHSRQGQVPARVRTDAHEEPAPGVPGVPGEDGQSVLHQEAARAAAAVAANQRAGAGRTV